MPDFGPAEIAIIKETWALVGTLPTETVGGLLFKHIFEQADVSQMFSFGRKPGFDPSPDAVAAHPDVQKHGANVVKTVTTAISLLTDLETLVPVLKDLGAKHAKYGVVAAHYPVVGGAFLKTLKVGLADKYTPEVAAAYLAMWGIVEATMLSGAEEAAAKAAPAADPQWGKQSYSNTTPPAEIEKSQNSAMDWYANPSAAARGSS
jgi:hemoglobin-like flavoprotein